MIAPRSSNYYGGGLVGGQQFNMDGQFRGHEVRFAKDGGYGNRQTGLEQAQIGACKSVASDFCLVELSLQKIVCDSCPLPCRRSYVVTRSKVGELHLHVLKLWLT